MPLLMGIKYDGNHARRTDAPFWYWVCMATLAAILLGVCIHWAAMDYAKGIPVRGEYAAENDRAMELYGITVHDRDE
jgi:hypothetical protein